jgi:hypothetical protein
MKNNEITYLLIACGFRSGASLTSSIINAHPDVSVSADIVKYWNYCFGRYPVLDKEILINMLKELKFRLSVRFSIEIDVNVCLENIGDNFQHESIYIHVMNHIVKDNSSACKVVGECEGLTWTKIPFFLSNIQNSKAMLVLRDPRDVLVSFKKNTIASGNDYLVSVFNNLSLMQSWLAYEIQFKERFLGVRFEELKDDTEGVARSISDFLGIKLHPSMLDDGNWTKLGKDGWVEWENHGSSSFANDKKLQKNPVGRWRTLIDPVDHFICEWVCGDLMKKFNIDLEFSDFSRDIFEDAIKKLMSSELLKNCFYQFICFNNGSEKYPLDPFNPKNWDKRYVDNLERLIK